MARSGASAWRARSRPSRVSCSRRAGGGARAGGSGRAPPSHRRDQDEAWLRRPGDRAQHGARHESLRAHPRPRRRPHHRRRHAGRDPRQSAKSAAPISGAATGCNERGARRSSPSRAWSSATAQSRPCAASTSRSAGARSSASSGRTAPARPRCSRRSPASFRPAAGSDRLRRRAARRRRARGRDGAGIALVPEGRHIFASLTVAENLDARRDRPARPGRVRADIERFYSRRFRSSAPAGGSRPGSSPAASSSSSPSPAPSCRGRNSDARRALARARAGDHRPGLRPARGIRAEGVTILLVEQNAERAFASPTAPMS